MRLSVEFAPWCGGVRTTWGLGAWRLFGWIRRDRPRAGVMLDLVSHLLMLSGVVPHEMANLIINARLLCRGGSSFAGRSLFPVSFGPHLVPI